jgi:hypothetical protein
MEAIVEAQLVALSLNISKEKHMNWKELFKLPATRKAEEAAKAAKELLEQAKKLAEEQKQP